jgi:hypothetical protein
MQQETLSKSPEKLRLLKGLQNKGTLTEEIAREIAISYNGNPDAINLSAPTDEGRKTAQKRKEALEIRIKKYTQKLIDAYKDAQIKK